MNVIVKRSILFYCDKYPAAKVALLAWYKEFCDVDYKNFNELKQEYANASLIANSRVIFNIKHNFSNNSTGLHITVIDTIS